MPRPRRTELTQQEILDAAARTIARKGLSGATMQDIAHEAGLTAPTLYAYFPGKREILRGLVELLLKEGDAAFTQALPPSLDFAQRLELLLLRFSEIMERRRGVLTMLIEGGPGQSEDSKELHLRGHAHHQRRLQEWLVREGRGLPFAGAPEEATLALSGLIHAYFTHWLLTVPSTPFSRFVPAIVRFFLHGALGEQAEPRAQPTSAAPAASRTRRA